MAPSDVAKALDKAFQAGRLATTGKNYTFDAETQEAENIPFKPKAYPEYELNGKRYIRVEARPRDADSVLSNGKRPTVGDIFWVEVLPIEWLVETDGKSKGWWVAKKGLFAGIQFDQNSRYDGDFDKTNMKKYLDTYFSKEMESMRTASRSAEQPKTKFKEASHKLSFGVQVIDEPMSVKDQIDFYIKTGSSFMLHGPSGVGKTARVEAVDPDLTAVPLWNGVLPEDIVGKVRYASGTVGFPTAVVEDLMRVAGREKGGAVDAANLAKLVGQHDDQAAGIWVAPDWYTELCRKCAAAPDKQHVLFIDEVTNAKPTTQSLIFHIVLKKSISPSKGKLPANAVVVLAGNDKADSGAAYNMPAPLFRRMAGHIYLEANLAEWLEWASEKNNKYPRDPARLNIHPLVAQFLATYSNAFYSGYDEENPESWAIDPRGWEQISDVIYNNGNVIRRELIENKIGKENAAALLAFAREPLLSLDDVLNNTFDKEGIPASQTQKLAVTLGMRHADMKQVRPVREFVGKYLGAENLAIFDSIWVGANEERAIHVSNMTQFQRNAKVK